MRHDHELLQRHGGNPILSPDDWPYPVNTVFNPGATLLDDGTTLLLCRVEDFRGISHFCVARSRNGIDNWEIEPRPTLEPDPEKYPEEIWGIEDPRITKVEDEPVRVFNGDEIVEGRYVVTYTAYSRGGPGVSLAVTNDFETFHRCGEIMPPEDKDAALLPRKIGGHYALVHRPVGPLGAHIWISYSPDLRHWGSHKLVLEARRGGWWDANKVGLSPPPVLTDEGWLVLYHGVRRTASGSIYRVGLALLDLDCPETVLLRGDRWVFGPVRDYERHGDVENVVFPCGVVVEPGTDLLRIYYGAADTCIGLATARLGELLDWLKEHGRDVEAGLR